ncbi:SPOR domain-containing protein [Mesorhizobium sp. M7A.F.Ca.US.001.04.2.1]|uniref:SPOR domain-containing protein n=2 Tax=unclassified Mesorhizobium TaxID=325217 RepID=UPI000FCB695C|nr:SPOR domain-containing protein [Mesorhizobium sp. M7A.F.Ca.US.001.04.2.1]RUY22656.1 SPOR domain-containing protein [Mesorhizobium sp. M7A.F.Ca.US.001.04.2.1]
MADRTQLRVADNNDIAEDDPFAELTRIMGFDPRQPVRPQSPAQPQAPAADHGLEEGDFDIDLEKEMMGEFGADDSDAAPVVQAHEPTFVHEPAFEAADASAMDDELSVSLDDDFELDMAEIDDHVAGASHAVAAEAVPSVEPAFASDIGDAVAGSLEDVAPFEDDQSMADELAASLDQDLRIDEEAEEALYSVADTPASVEPVASDDEFDDAVAMSLEDELMLDDHSAAEQSFMAADPIEHAMPEQAAALDGQAISDESFAGLDDAMADVDMDFDVRADEPIAFDEPEAHEVLANAADSTSEISNPEGLSDDAFDLNFEDSFAETVEEPVAEVAAATVQPAAPEANVAPAVHAPIADERSLEDELNALLGAMTSRTAPVASEPVTAQPAVAAPPPVAQPAEEPADLVGDLDWDLDETTPEQNRHVGTAQAADADINDLMLDELQDPNSDTIGDVDFDDDALDAALAQGLDPRDEAAPRDNSADSFDWLAERSQLTEPTRSWSRVTPVPQQPSFSTQPTFSAQPAASVASSMAAAPAVAAMTSYGSSEPVETLAPAAPVSAPQSRQPARYEDMPDVETVDVPERVVALADDLDIPELHFEEDQPASPGYDDLDAEFSSLLSEMNAVEVAAAPASNAAGASYDDGSYAAGFKPGYDSLKPGYDGVKPGYEPEARTYAARPMEMSARAAAPTGYADASGYDLDNLPGSQPASQADDFTVDELDYDPELDEEMAVPGLGEREAARPSRGRGLFIAAIVGAVAVAGGLGAFALSFGGKGGSEAPVIVKADNAPIKVKPENPGGAVVPNQDNKVYDAVRGAKPAEPVQEKLVTNTEEPVDVQAKDPARAIDLSPDQNAAGAGTDVGNAAPMAGAALADNTAPAPKSEDRIAQVLQDADKGTNADVVAIAPRKVRTMVVKSDGSLVPREDPAAPAAPQVAATEPVDPAPQHVAPAAQANADQTGTVAPAAAQADDEPALKPVAKPKAEAKAQSANTPAKVPLAPQRPSDQPVDVVGEVKPDQVASIDPASTAAGGGSWSMQIASQPTVESAQSSYQDLQRRYGSVLAGRTANIVKAEIAGKGTFYRVRVPAQSRNDAINLCTSYKAAGGNCFVSR